MESSKRKQYKQLGKEFVGLDYRTESLGDLESLEPGFRGICERVEELYGPKKILDHDDWLVDEEEDGQTYMEFEKDKDWNRVTEKRKIIYLLMVDSGINADF